MRDPAAPGDELPTSFDVAAQAQADAILAPDDTSSSAEAAIASGARGGMLLALRQLLVQLLSIAAAVVLARLLSPAEFGVYGITVFLMHFLVVFGDAGLAAGLIREAEEPEERDYQAIFSFQQLLVAVVAAVGFVLAPVVSLLLWPEGGLGWLLQAVLVALLLSSFQTVPVARLERRLAFDKLTIVEVAQAVAFNGIAVAGALLGYGADAMAAALVARSVSGVLLLRSVSAQPLAWNWDWSRVRSRLRFGLAFQGGAFVNLLRDSLVPVFVGATLGNAAVGGIFFARMLAFYPFLIVYMLQRVLMPMFARLQTEPQELARAVALSLFAVAALVVPVQTTVWALQEPLLRIVFGEQWLGSLDVYRWLWFAVLLEPQIVVGIALLHALGKADRVLRFSIASTVGLWLAAVPLLLAFGPVGFGMAALLMLAIKWQLVADIDRAAGVKSLVAVAPVWLAGSAAAATAALLRLFWPPEGVVSLGLLLLAAFAVYALVLLLVARERSVAALGWLRGEASAAAGGLVAARPAWPGAAKGAAK